MYTPVNPSFTIYKWGLKGSKLYRYVFLMVSYLINVLCFSLVCRTCVVCRGLFGPLGVIGSLCSVTVAIPGQLIYIFQFQTKHS